MSATFKRAAAFLIALCLTVGMFGQLVFADDYVETEETASEEVLETGTETEGDELADIQLEEPESEEEETSAETEVESESTEDVDESTEHASESPEIITETAAEETENETEDVISEETLGLLEDGYIDGGEVSEGAYTYYVGQNESWKVKYVPEESGLLTVYSSANMDTYGYLYDIDNNMLLSDDDGGENNNFRYTYSVVAGETYYIGFRFYNSDNSGNIPINISLTIIQEGWNETAAGQWFYVKDGEILKGWQEIDGVEYYFDYSNGIMAANTTKWIDGYNYRFDESGQVYIGWYYNNWGDTYYYDENGRAASGLTTIDGNKYYFDSNGYMWRNTTYNDSANGKLIVIGNDGIVTDEIALNENGWTQAGSDWYYFENGYAVNGWKKIDGYWYYFDWNGKMYANTTFSTWNVDAGTEEYYRVDASGHMVTGWYKENSSWYYYDNSGKAPQGLTTVGGKQYYFGNAGYMYTSTTVFDNNSKKIIIVGSDGVVTSATDAKNGWNKVGNDWYYFENESAVNGWKKIDGYWYYFDWNGRMYSDTTFSVWDHVTGTSTYYRVDASGHMITGWYQYYNGWYYYYESGNSAGAPEGSAARGVQTVNGVKYCFSYEGRMLTDQTYYAGTSIIKIDIDGHVIGEINSDTDGWKQIGSDWYYASQGSFVRDSLMDIDGYTYYFDYDGIMFKDGVCSVYSSGPGDYEYHGFDKSGHMIKGNWFENISNDGRWYYFDPDGNPLPGLQTIEGKEYFFSVDGSMEVSRKHVVDNTLYVIDESGNVTKYSGANGWVANYYYVDNGEVVSDGWKNIGGYWYYFSNGGPYRNRYANIDGKYYYFDSSGAMRTKWIKYNDGSWLYAEGSGALKENTWYQEDGIWYYFDSVRTVRDIITISGKTYLFNSNSTYVGEVSGTNKWLSNDKYWYYLKADGSFARSESLTISGTKYYFDHNGRMVTEQSYWENNGSNYYGSNGKQTVSAWVNMGERWQYYDEKGVRVENAWKKIGSSWYYFDGSGYMVYGDRIIDNQLYHFSNGGVWDGKSGTALKKGWNLVSGDYYYYDGSSLYTGIHEIGGATYCFEYDGKMVHDNTGYYSRIWTSSGAALKNGWYKDRYGSWYYADASGNMAEGLKTIGGKQYYFSYGRMLTFGRTYDNVYYDIGADGVVKKTVTANGTKWTQVSDGWVYCKDGIFLNGMHKVDGSYYYFESGKMLTDYVSYYYGYFGTDGKLVKSEGWVKDSYGDWYYLFNGTRASGSRYIDGKWYYFSYGYAVEGVFFADGSFYKYAGASGGRTKLSFSEGWNKYNGSWYYVEDNYLVKNGVIKDGSKYYYLDFDGKMSNGEIVVYYYGVKYLQSNGTFLKNGWKKLDGTWYYFGPDGNALTGTWTIDGTTYQLTTPNYYGGGIGGKA